MRQKKLVYYGKKCLIFLISVFILSVAVFYVARLAPGDPLISYYGDRTEKMSPEEREWAMGKLGLNEPISVQYVKWVKNAFHGEFGISFKYKQDPVCQPVFVPGTQNSQEQGSGKHNDKSDSSKHKCITDTAADHVHYILFIFK